MHLRILKLAHVCRTNWNCEGNRNIKNTLMYIQLSKALYKNNHEGFICEVAEKPKDISELIEKRFEFVCDSNGKF